MELALTKITKSFHIKFLKKFCRERTDTWRKRFVVATELLNTKFFCMAKISSRGVNLEY
jgi:hypothetical protein